MKSKEFWDWFETVAPKLATHPSMDRSVTFRAMFEHLDGFGRPINIIETGCIEEPDNWAGNGCSTILFDKYVATHPGSTARSVELDGNKVLAAQSICPNVVVTQGDSVEYLKWAAKHVNVPIDLLYLDASHHDWINETPSQVHHFNELMAIMPLLHDRSLVAVDDSVTCVDDYPKNKIIGKGGLVAQYALEVAAKLEFCHYQIGFTKITGSPITERQIEEIIGRARLAVEEGRNEEADRLYYLILASTPPPWNGKARVARGEAAGMFGRGAHRLNKFGVAVDWFRTAIDADPMSGELRCDLAISLVALGAMEPARRVASIAVEVEPKLARTWQTLGGVEADMRDAEAAIAAYDQQIETARGVFELSDALLNRATIALDTRDYDKVRDLCRNILELDVRKGDAYHMMAMLEYRLSRHESAIKMFDRALENNCRNQPLAHWNKALPLESIGRLREAGVEKAWNEFEMTVPSIMIPQHRFNKPKWRGEPPEIEGRKAIIHVHTEAGHGDNISMFRYFNDLLGLGYEVHYECDPLLISLVEHNFPDVLVMPRCKDYPGVVGIKPFDYHIPIGDLPHAFGTDLDSIPWSGPYLKADPALVASMAEKLPADTKGRRVGLCWSSGIRKNISIWMEKYGRQKSMHLTDMAPILFATTALMVSLQVGDGREESGGQLLDVLPESPSWDETAALIENLDLVITVDTGVAHLAGAMGKPTWVVMQQDGASWHFMCEREGAAWNEASPWYPSIRIFRQPKPYDWNGAIAKVVKALAV
jgi:tetratricopeptide (TPR) repeat protein